MPIPCRIKPNFVLFELLFEADFFRKVVIYMQFLELGDVTTIYWRTLEVVEIVTVPSIMIFHD